MGIKRVRVLHISKYYSPFAGGTEKVARNCVKALADTGKYRFEQVVFCFDHDRQDASGRSVRSRDVVDRVDGVQVVRCGCEAKAASQSLSLSYGKRLKAVFDRFCPDVVVLHYPNPFGTHFLLQYLKPETRLVVFWHLDIVRQKILGRLFQGQNKRLLRRADCVIAASPNYADGSPWLRKFREKCVIIPDCIEEWAESADDGSAAAYEQQISERYGGRILCLAVGRHVEYKGFHYLIEAAGYLDEHIVIVITGQGPLTPKLKKQAELTKGGAEIVFAGLVPDAELQAYLKRCDIFCFPSITKNEAFGIALAEAMYCGKPSVTFTIEGSGVNFVSLDGVTGIECPNRDSRAYAEAIRKLAEDPQLRKEMGAAARKRVEELFLYNRFAEKIRDLFENLSDR